MIYILHVVLYVLCFAYRVYSINVTLSEETHGTVFIDGKTLCGPIFQKAEARVVCRHLNYTDGIVLPPNNAMHSDKFQLNCNGNESSLSECEVKQSFCSRSRHYYYISYPPADVLCYNDMDNVEGNIELVSNVGRVTVNMFGIAAAVCADKFDDRTAGVTCRMKGYKDGVAFDINKSGYEDLVLLGGIQCSGNESSLFQCQRSQTWKCKQAYAVSAGVICFNKQAPVVQFDGERGLYTVTVDNRVVFYCLQGQFYPHNRFAPHHDAPKDTIACKSLVFVEQKENVSNKKKKKSIFSEYKITKMVRDPIEYNCHGGWMYKLRWWWRQPESFICGNPHKSSGTIFIRKK